MSGRLRRSIVVKLAIPLLVTGIALPALSWWFTTRALRRQLERGLMTRAEGLRNSLNNVAEVMGPSRELRRIVVALGAEQGVNEILLAGGSPLTIIAATKGAWLDRPLDEVVAPHLAAAANRVSAHTAPESLWNDRDGTLTLLGPLLFTGNGANSRGMARGVALIRLDTTVTRARIRQEALVATLTPALGLVLFAGLTGVLLYSTVLAPVRTMSAVIRRRAAGDGGAYAQVSEDELGHVADSLNQLFDTEAESRARLEAQAQDLIKARDAALAATRAKSEFLAMMSHEIRTPLNGVTGMTALLLDSPLAAEQREYAETIRMSADSLMTVIDDVLDFSKIEADRMILDERDFDLRAPIDAVVDLLRARADDKQLELTAFVDPALPFSVVGDEARLRQVLLNLASNAVKFTAHGGVQVRVSPLAATADGRVAVRFEVLDSGLGLTADQMARLFKPFTQADTSTTRRFGGTGLGLAISKRLVEAMGGAIAVESEPDQGSRFWFDLHLSIGARPAPALPEDQRGAIVAVIDDHAATREATAAAIAAIGFTVEAFPDLQQWREWLHTRRPACRCVVVSERAPALDAGTLAIQLGDDAVACQVPRVLTMAARRWRQASAEAAAAGFEIRVARAITLGRVHDAVQRAMTRPSAPTVKSPPPEVAPREAQSDQRLSATASSVQTPSGDRLVLVVEDNAVNQRVAERLLSKLGCRVTIAADGAQALDVAAQQPVDLILMDCHMPVMDGFDATRALRARQGDRCPPIVALTASATLEDRARCLEAGMDDVMSKPVKPDVLKATLERWLPRAS